MQPVFRGKLSTTAGKLDKATGGALKRAIKNSRFKGKRGQFLEIVAPAGLKNGRILLAGLGKPGDLKEVDLENLGGSVVGRLGASGEREAAIMVDAIKGFKHKAPARAAHYGLGALLRSFRFDKYKT